MGKSQFADSKPAATFIDSKLRFASPEDVSEISEELEAIEKKRQKEASRANKVSRFLNDNFYRIDKTWVFLYWPTLRRQLSVRFYWPKKNLAVDQFRTLDKVTLAEIDFKKKILKEKGIKYFPMLPDSKLLDLADYV